MRKLLRIYFSLKQSCEFENDAWVGKDLLSPKANMFGRVLEA